MRAILLELALYKLWTLLGWRLDTDGLLWKDFSSHRFEEAWTLAITYRPTMRMEPWEVATMCSMLEVCGACLR